MKNPSINRRQFICQSLKTVGAAYLVGLMPLGNALGKSDDDLFIDSFRPESSLILNILDIAGDKRAEFADVFVEQSVSRTFTFVNNHLIDSQFKTIEGVSIRAMTEDFTAWATTDSFQWNPVKKIAKSVRKQLESYRTNYEVAPLPKFPLMDFGTIIAKKKLSQSSDRDVLMALKAIVVNNPLSSNLITESKIVCTDTIRRILVANSQGVFVMDNQPSIDLTFTQSAKSGKRNLFTSRSVGYRCGLEFLENSSVLDAMYRTSSETVESISSKQISSGKQPLLLAPSAAKAITQDLIEKIIKTPASTPLDIPSHLILEDNGRIQNGRATAHFDDEGSYTSKTMIVNKQRVATQLNQRDSAKRKVSEFTGNGRRESYLTQPQTAPTNICLKTTSPVETLTLADLGTGLMITQMEPVAPAADSQQSRFLINSGWQIKNGQRLHPVRNVMITAPFPGLMNRIQKISNDVLFFADTYGDSRIPVSYGAPSMLLADVSVVQLEA